MEDFFEMQFTELSECCLMATFRSGDQARFTDGLSVVGLKFINIYRNVWRRCQNYLRSAGRDFRWTGNRIVCWPTLPEARQVNIT